MDGNFPPWSAQGRLGEEGAYNTSQECQGLDNTLNISAHYGNETVDGSYRESLFPHIIWPQIPQNKEADLTREVLSVEVESSYTHSASKTLSPDCQGLPSGTEANSGKHLYFPINQHPIRSNTGDVAESYGERTAAERRERYRLISDNLPAGSVSDAHVSAQEKNQEIVRGNSSNWTSVIKEALEMSNGMELEQDLSVDMCRTPVVYEEPESRVLEPMKDHFHSLEHMSSVQEGDKRKEVNRACDSSVTVSSDGAKMLPIESKQDVRQRRIIQELYSFTDGSSANDKILKGTESSTLEHCSLREFHNETEVCSLLQHTVTEQTEASDITKKPCVSNTSSLIRIKVEEQSKNLYELASNVPSLLSDNCGNEDCTVPSTDALLRLNAEHSSYSIGHAESGKNVKLGKCADSQTKFSEEYFSEGDNATLSKSFSLPDDDLKVQVTQITKLESDGQNLRNTTNLIGQHGYAWSETNVNLNNSKLQNEKLARPLSGLMAVEENWCSDLTEATSISNNQHCPSKSNLHNEKVNALRPCVFDSNSAEPSCVCSSTSVSKLEDLVHNLCKVIPSTPTLKSTEPCQTQTESTNEIVSENEGSNLPPRQEVCLNNLSNAECRLAKEAAFTNKTLSAVQRIQKVEKKQKKPIKRNKTADLDAHGKRTGISCSIQQPHNMEPLEPSTSFVSTAELKHSDTAPSTKNAKLILSTPNKHDFAASQTTENFAQISKTLNRSPRKTLAPSNILDFPEPYVFENVQDASHPIISEIVPSIPNPQNALKKQKMPRKIKMLGCRALTGQGQKTGEKTSVICGGAEMQVTHKSITDLCPKRNLEILSIKKEDETEYERVSLTTDVPLSTKRKQRIPKKITMQPEENGKILVTSCSSSVESCVSPTKKLHLQQDTFFSPSKRTEIQNVKQCNAVAFIKQELTNVEDNNEMQGGINSEMLPDNAVPVSEDKKSLPTMKQRTKRALRIDDTSAFNQSHSPCEDSSRCTDSTSVIANNRSTNIKKTRRVKKNYQETKNDVTVDNHAIDHSVYKSPLHSSAVIPVTQTEITNVDRSEVMPKKPRKKRVSKVKNKNAETSTASQAVSQQEKSVFPLISETLESRITSTAEVSVKAKRLSKKSCKKEANTATSYLTDGPSCCDKFAPVSSLSVSETSCVNLSVQNIKKPRKRKSSKPQDESTKPESHLSLLEQGTRAPRIEHQRSKKCIKMQINEDAKCIKSASKVKTPRVCSEDAITPCSVSNAQKKTVRKKSKEFKKENGQKAQDHSDTQIDSTHNLAQGMVSTPDLQLDFCIMKTSEELLNCDRNKAVVKKKEKKSQKSTKNAGTVDPYLFTETVSPVKLQNAVQPMPSIKIEPEKLCDTRKKARNNLKKSGQQESGTKKHPLVRKTGTKNVKLEPEVCQEMPVTQCQVSDTLNKEIISVKVDPPKDHSTELCQRDDLIRIKNSLQVKKRVGRPYKRKTLIKMAKLLSTIQEPSESITVQDLQKVPQCDASKDLMQIEETRTDSPMNTSRKSCRSRKNNLSENTHNCSNNIVLSDLCKSHAEETRVISHSAATMDGGTLNSKCLIFSGAGKKSAGRGRPPKKQRKSTTLRAQTAALEEPEKIEDISSEKSSKINKSRKSSVTKKNNSKSKILSIPPLECDGAFDSADVKSVPANVVKRKIGRPKRKRVLLKIAISGRLEKAFADWNISSPADMVNLPLTVPVHSRRGGNKSKMKSPNLQLSNLRQSKRLAKVKGVQQPHLRVANKISSNSQTVYQRDRKKAQKSSKRKGDPSSSNVNEPLPNQSNCSVANEKDQTTDKDSGGVSGSSLGHHLKISKNKEAQISSVTRKRKPKTEIISSAMSLSSHTKKKVKKCDYKRRTTKQQSNAKSGENPGIKTGSRSKITKCKHTSGQVPSRKTVGEQLQQKLSESDKLLDLSENALKAEMHKEALFRDEEKSSKDFHTDTSKTLLNSENKGTCVALLTNSVPKLNKNVKGRAHRKKTCSDKRTKEKVLGIKPNGGDAFELSEKSDNTGLHPSKTDKAHYNKKVKDQVSEKILIDASVKVSDQHEHTLSIETVGKDVTLESSLGKKFVSEVFSHQHPQVQKTDGFTQYCDEDYMTTLNKETCLTAVKTPKRGSLSKGIVKKTITCKYCSRVFHHISAYTVHRRIHTGEKPYACKHCGKNFAHLSKIKSHRKVHMQPTSLNCPCCTKKFTQKYDLVSHFKVHLQESQQNHKLDKIIQCKPKSLSVDNNSLICKICGNNFTNKFMLKSHMHIHRREKLLSCKVCGKKFQKSLQLVAHEKTHWPVKPYACSICGKGFNRLKALKKHSQEHTGETPFSCCHCSHAFSDLSALRAHQASKLCIGKQRLNGNHRDIEGFLVYQGVDGQVNTPVFFKCQICKQLYQKWCQYTLHLQTHTKSPPYLCFSCGQSYEKDSEVIVHCKVCCHSSGEEVSCGASLSDVLHGDAQNCTYYQSNSQINHCSLQTSTTKNNSQSSVMPSEENSQACDNSLPRTEQLTSQPCPVMKDSSLPETVHLPKDDQLIINSSPASPSVMSCASSNDSLECIEISPSLWKFECPRCGQRYERYRALYAHMQTHAPGFRYVCGRCGKSFERWNRLWLHQRIHRVKSCCYSCSQCNLQFTFFSSYKDHLMSHAGERPFGCPLCPQTFVHEEGLHAHQCALHQLSKSLQCDVCAKSFSSLRNLVKHSLLHNGTISHQCLTCSLSFTNNKILQEHLKMHSNSLGLPLPDIPPEPLSYPYNCKKCKACFSTGDLLYAHQICHPPGSKSPAKVCSTHTNESTSLLDGSPHPCNESITPSISKSLISALNLDAIPDDESLYTYPHPDKLYVTPVLSSVRLQIINLDSEDEELQQTSSNGHISPSTVSRSGLPGQKVQDSTQLCTETDTTDLPQVLESPQPSPHTECMPALHKETITSNVQDKAIPNDLTWTDRFVQMSVFLEGPTTSVNTDENGEQKESFECVDCSEQLRSLEELHGHYFLHALGNKCLHIN